MRRRKSIFDLFDELIRELDRELAEEIRDLHRRWERFFEEVGDVERIGPKPVVYGFRLTIGPDGIPRIERFGNVKIRRGAEGPVREVRYSEDMEPLVDIYEEKDTITVVAEIPGVEKENIKLKGRGSKLIIDARNSRKYYKEIDLPHDVDVSRAKATYKNGVLEIKLPKVKKEDEGVEIKVE